MADAPFTINPVLTAIAVGYKNPDVALIADAVLPRVSTAATFNWTEYDTAQAFTVPETRVGRRSEPNIVTFGGTSHTDTVQDFGLDDPVPQPTSMLSHPCRGLQRVARFHRCSCRP